MHERVPPLDGGWGGGLGAIEHGPYPSGGLFAQAVLQPENPQYLDAGVAAQLGAMGADGGISQPLHADVAAQKL